MLSASLGRFYAYYLEITTTADMTTMGRAPGSNASVCFTIMKKRGITIMNVSGPADTMDLDRQGTRRRQGEDPYGMGRAGREGGAGVPGKSPGPQGCVTTLCEGCVGQPNKNSRGKNAESARVRSYVWGVRVPR